MNAMPPRKNKGKAKSGERSDDITPAAGDVPEADVDDGYDVNRINEEYALVLMGGSAVVVRENPSAPPLERLRIMKIEAFKAFLQNRYKIKIQSDGKKKAIPFGVAWLGDPKRRQYDGIEFHPDPDDEPGTAGYLNLWRGFSIPHSRPNKPVQRAEIAMNWARVPTSVRAHLLEDDVYEYCLEREPGRKKTSPDQGTIFKDHLLNNVCGGDLELFEWLFAWFAQIFQNPREKPGTSLVFRGPMGAGKSIIGEVFGKLLGQHYFQVDDPRYITGQFNAHMAACLLLLADEAVWAGDKVAEGRLKGLITSQYQMIENKGVDPVRLPNYVRVIQTSNEAWVVPAGKDERRFAVFDVEQTVCGDHGYFADMMAELENGGYEALLEELLSIDLKRFNLRSIPKTAALLDQKIHSFDPVEQWLFDRLMAGHTIRKAGDWWDWVTCDVFRDDYIDATERIGIKRKASEAIFGKKLLKLLPGVRRVRRTVPVDDAQAVKRAWVYELPALPDARQQFENALGQSLGWAADD